MVLTQKSSAGHLNGFLDEGAEFRGELRFRDTFRIDGRVRGRIISDNTLVIGETGHVEADIDCGIVSVRGFAVGHIRGRQKVELLGGARVQGTIVAPRLVVEEGAILMGDCDMSAEIKAPAALPAPMLTTEKQPAPSDAGPSKPA
ncbi:MAG: polymer-forming cytoskeletal protein [Vicinamibacteria bacterium]|jgi:cytoskeletal protein CcmA (bactofilin family)|nr:polymer-forming cytoskeletal protein [Vicinamibacteria bacterium]